MLDGSEKVVARVHIIQHLIHTLQSGQTCSHFFRDEYQELSGNLPHIHGLFAYSNEDAENEDFQRLMSELQKCAVCDLFSTTEIENYINDGLFKNEDDWFKMTALAQEVLSHKCTPDA